MVYWEQQINAAEGRFGPVNTPPPMYVGLLTLEEPIWTRGVLGFEALLPERSPTSPRIAFICGSGDPGAKPDDPVTKQPTDDLGRLTRAIPMFFAEEILLRTAAKGCFVVPWMKGGGFVLSAKPWQLEDLHVAELHADFVVLLHIDAQLAPWKMTLTIRVAADASKVAEWEEPIDVRNSAATVTQSLLRLIRSLKTVTSRQVPEGLATVPQEHLPRYLAATEQALAVSTAAMESSSSNLLYAERAIIDNLLLLALATPSSVRTRCRLLNTLEKEARRRPDVVREYREKLRRLQIEHPLPSGATANIIDAALATLETKLTVQ